MMSSLWPFLVALIGSHARSAWSGSATARSIGSSIIAEKVMIEGDPTAVCIDGTRPGFYLWRGPETKRFTIHHEGGGWCASQSSCADRSKTGLGSSASWPNVTDLQGIVDGWGAWYLSIDAAVNPLMHNWTKILFKYCDGASFLGNQREPMQGPNGELLHFRGRRILRAGIQKMLRLGLKDASSVVVNGGSAGGLAVYHHADHYAAMLPSSDVVALPDGGFFRPLPEIANTMKWVYAHMNVSGSLDQGCRLAHPASEWRCLLAENKAPHVGVAMFALQSRYDSFQTSLLYTSDPSAVTEFGLNMTLLLRSRVLQTRPDNAVWIDSCHHHTGGWPTLTARSAASSSPLPAGQALAEWWKHRVAANPLTREWLQDFDFPCAHCCPCACAEHGGCTDCCDYPSTSLDTCGVGDSVVIFL